ncbi:MAG: PGN_0703 family putative restriction endonuclease [Janthinobacterium lividum]
MRTAANLRRELSARNLVRAAQLPHEQSCSNSPSVVFRADEAGKTHGNFLDASFRRIQANPAWASRLSKVYTASRNLARQYDGPLTRERSRHRELDCAHSSDALLMNIFCYPGLLARSAAQGLLGLTHAVQPEFGVRIGVPLHPPRAKRSVEFGIMDICPDRTEIDCRVADLLIEAKLTETGFQTAPARLVSRYLDLEEVFDLNELPRHANGAFLSYQLIRGVLAAHTHHCRFAVLADARRPDLLEHWFRVIRAVRSFALRSRLQILTWQELSTVTPPRVQAFLASKYGIVRC